MMKILPVSLNSYNKILPIENRDYISFQGNWSLKDVFMKNKEDKSVSEIKNIRAGEYGTKCKGSIPLKDFTKVYPYNSNRNLYRKGISTNVDGNSHSLLKSKWNVPIATSGVHDCSVMYLCNENKKTHFLYHMYSDADEKHITKIIKSFMPEGYTKAALIPGDNFWAHKHKVYLSEVFEAIKENGNGAKIKIYHDSSFLPEIVCYKGDVYEIPRLDSDEHSFRIKDWYSYDILDYIEMTVSEFDVAKLRENLNSKRYNAELLEAIDLLLDNRKIMLKQINEVKTLDELKLFIINNQSNPYFNREYILPIVVRMETLFKEQYGCIPDEFRTYFDFMQKWEVQN